MKQVFFGLHWSLTLSCLLASGCTKPAPPAPIATQLKTGPEAAVKEPSSGVVTIKAEDLPTLGSPLPPLDGGRLVVRGPDKWLLQSRSNKYLAKYQKNERPYPQVIVSVKEATGIVDLKEDNLGDFVKQVQLAVEREMTEGPVKIVEDVQPIKLENHPAVYYVRKAKANGLLLERVLIMLVVAGREYTVELRGDAATTKDYEPFAQAVANGLEFHSSDAPATNEPASEDTELK